MFPCKTGSCSRVIAASLLWLVPMHMAVAVEQGRAVISPLVTLGKLAVALTVVLIVFWIFAKIMRQVQGYQNSGQYGLKIISALPVGQRERVVVIQAGDEQLVLGVTSTQINTLHVLERPLSQVAPGSMQGDFKQKLSAALKRQVSAP